MKTLLGTLLALGLLSTAANAQYCAPYGYGYRTASYGHNIHRRSHVKPPIVVEQAPVAPAPQIEATPAPIEPAPLPQQPEELPPK